MLEPSVFREVNNLIYDFENIAKEEQRTFDQCFQLFV